MSEKQVQRYYWLKLNEDFFEDDVIEWLEEQANGKDYVLFYLKLCLKSLKKDGLLIRQVGKMLIPYDIPKLAEITRTNVDTVAVAVDVLQKVGLLEIEDSGAIYMTQLHNMVGSEAANANAQRQKRFREKQKTLLVTNSNATTVTKNNESKSKSKSIELDKELDIFNAFAGDDEELLTLLKDFESMRKQIKKPMTKRAKELLVNKLRREFPNRNLQVATLSQSIMNCWQGIFAVKDPPKNSPTLADYDYGEYGIDHL